MNTTIFSLNIVAITDTPNSEKWLQYFRPADAINAVMYHIANLPSAGYEGHTARSYIGGLKYFLEWAQRDQPTLDMLSRFVAHLKHEKHHRNKVGITTASISSRYLPPVRLYLKALAAQSITARNDGTPLSLDDRHTITDIREQFRLAASMKNPSPEQTSNLSALEATGTRLTLEELNLLYSLCDTSKLRGKRDLALFYVAFNTAMRAAELSRLTLSNIQYEVGFWLVHVRGKGGNMTPPVLDQKGYDLLRDYIESFNAVLLEGDIRRIGTNTPVWKPIQWNDTPFPADYQDWNPQSGLTPGALRAICNKYGVALSKVLQREISLSTHDTRRSYAKIMWDSGADIMDISLQLRHKSISTTQIYIGPRIDRRKGLLSSRVSQAIPSSKPS
jgi:integrase